MSEKNNPMWRVRNMKQSAIDKVNAYRILHKCKDNAEVIAEWAGIVDKIESQSELMPCKGCKFFVDGFFRRCTLHNLTGASVWMFKSCGRVDKEGVR